MNSRWEAVREPVWECNQAVFADFYRRHGHRRNVLNCAIPPARAKVLTDFTMPEGWDADKSLIACVGFGAKLPPGLEKWSYTPKIQAVKQLPQMKELSREHSTLASSPWFQSPSQALGLGINARHLPYHYQLWNDIQPKTLRGVFTTLVYVTPQMAAVTCQMIIRPLKQPMMFRGRVQKNCFMRRMRYHDGADCGVQLRPHWVFEVWHSSAPEPFADSPIRRWRLLLASQRARLVDTCRGAGAGSRLSRSEAAHHRTRRSA